MFRLTIVLAFILSAGAPLALIGQPAANLLIPLSDITLSPAGIAQPGSGIQKIADGKFNSDAEIFHTLWEGISKQDITIEATIHGKGKRLDKILVRPRGDGENGIIKSAGIWIMSKGRYRKVAQIEAELSNSPIEIELSKPILNPEKLKLVISDSYGDQNTGRYMVSLGEVECIMLTESAVTRTQLLQEAKIFSNKIGTKLRRNVTIREIQSLKRGLIRDFALQLYNNSYKPQARLANYYPTLNPRLLGQQKHIGSGFSKYGGITGVVLSPGDNLVFVGKTSGAKIKLLIPEWTRQAPVGINPEDDPAGWGLKKEEFILQEGPNLVHLEKGGNAYIQYFINDNPEKHRTIQVHFSTAKINGYFDITRGDTNLDFQRLLDNAVSPILDMRGKYIQVAFSVDHLRQYSKEKGRELLNAYDTILSLQRKLIGWEKEGFNPSNRILARVNYHYYMFRDEDGMAYLDKTMKMVADPALVIKGDACWGFSHETGHVHQIRQLTWGGMTEVSNNILSMYCTTSLGNKSRLLEENTYQGAWKSILDKGTSYLELSSTNAEDRGVGKATDLFHRLVPFWQLFLYFKEQGYSDFYPDLMISLRQQKAKSEGNKDQGYLDLLNFCIKACEVSKTDLTEFFERWGFFYVGKINVKDYADYNFHVSESDVEAARSEIKRMNLPKPKRDITQITD